MVEHISKIKIKLNSKENFLKRFWRSISRKQLISFGNIHLHLLHERTSHYTFPYLFPMTNSLLPLLLTKSKLMFYTQVPNGFDIYISDTLEKKWLSTVEGINYVNITFVELYTIWLWQKFELVVDEKVFNSTINHRWNRIKLHHLIILCVSFPFLIS